MQDFLRKRNALFASLDDASKELKGTALDQSSRQCSAIDSLKQSGEGGNFGGRQVSGDHARLGRISSPSPDRSLSKLRGKESIFKKPELPITKCLKPRKTPDYQINPHKWKKYSLSDVDISDQTNNRAAYAFLTEIEEQRAAKNALDGNTDDSKDTKIQFKKVSIVKRRIMQRNDDVADEEVDKPKLKGSKFVMPEYVVGQSRSKRKNHRTASELQKCEANKGKQLTLPHLQDYEDGDDVGEPDSIG